MATAWEDSVKGTKKLTVFAGSSVTGGPWASVFALALKEFNALSATHSFGVTLSASTTAPDNNGGGADVQFEAANGSISFQSFGATVSVVANGNGLSGDTQQVISVLGTKRQILKAFIVVPATPQINANPPRAVGDGVKLVIAVHELLHAAGLANADHNPNDLFNGFPQARAGSKPADDKIEVNQQKLVPPLFLTAQTAAKLKAVWT